LIIPFQALFEVASAISPSIKGTISSVILKARVATTWR